MNESTYQLVRASVAGGVRTLLVFVGGLLVKYGVVTSADNNTYIEQMTPVVIGVAMGLIGLGWSLLQKRWANRKIDLALKEEAGTSRTQLEEKHDVVNK